MSEEIKINKHSGSITFTNNGISFSQFGIAKEILDYIDNLQQKVEQLEKENEATLKNYGNLVKEWKQLENIRKEIKEYIEKQVVCCKNGDMLVELNVDDLLNILNKGE